MRDPVWCSVPLRLPSSENPPTFFGRSQRIVFFLTAELARMGSVLCAGQPVKGAQEAHRDRPNQAGQFEMREATGNLLLDTVDSGTGHRTDFRELIIFFRRRAGTVALCIALSIG